MRIGIDVCASIVVSLQANENSPFSGENAVTGRGYRVNDTPRLRIMCQPSDGSQSVPLSYGGWESDD